MELEMLRSEWREARMPRSHSTGHSLFAASTAAAERSDHERFTMRLPHHVREQVLRSRRLRHATSVIDLAGASPEGSVRGGRPAGSRGSFGNAGRREPEGSVEAACGGEAAAMPAGGVVLARMSWARRGGNGSVRKGWDGSTRRGRDDPDSSKKGAASPVVARP
ncbi:hypothetical protein ZWY2020_055157 [Hordeum vulgare]|nr:hypothetical protein ZWY2020_055157 [Hordeum vulgare]